MSEVLLLIRGVRQVTCVKWHPTADGRLGFALDDGRVNHKPFTLHRKPSTLHQSP